MEFDADRRGSVEFEAGFAMNDSGGGVFTVSDEGELLLAGIARGVSELGVTRRGSMSYAVLLEDHMDWIMSIIGEQSDWYAGWLEEQALNAALNEVAVETPAPGVGVALLGGVAIFARRRR
jgi:MYXO-CTERM domain-containing protein